jgi:hypothetical protein
MMRSISEFWAFVFVSREPKSSEALSLFISVNDELVQPFVPDWSVALHSKGTLPGLVRLKILNLSRLLPVPLRRDITDLVGASVLPRLVRHSTMQPPFQFTWTATREKSTSGPNPSLLMSSIKFRSRNW